MYKQMKCAGIRNYYIYTSYERRALYNRAIHRRIAVLLKVYTIYIVWLCKIVTQEVVIFETVS